MELFDENNKSLGVAFGGKAKGMGPKRISISGNNCMVNNVKYKLIASDELFICTLKTRRKDWNQDQFISIDRYTGDARISSRLRAKANTINNMFEDRYTCSKGKAKKKF